LFFLEKRTNYFPEVFHEIFPINVFSKKTTKSYYNEINYNKIKNNYKNQRGRGGRGNLGFPTRMGCGATLGFPARIGIIFAVTRF